MQVLADFSITPTNPTVCLGDATFFTGISTGSPTTYFWTVDGFPGLTGAGATANANITWPAAGTYTVRAVVSDPINYCTTEQSTTVTVIDPAEPVIVGPNAYCAGDTLIYSVDPPLPGYGYSWTITGGSIVLGGSTPAPTVVFDASGTASITVIATDVNAPFCAADPVTLTPSTISFGGPYAIETGDACPNQQFTYSVSPAVHPAASYAWTVSPAVAGSVVAGAGTASPTVQWNEYSGTATLTAEVTLCGAVQTLARSYTLAPAAAPTVTQAGQLCQGNSVTLSVDPVLYASALWNGTTPGLSLTVTSPGDYVVEVTDFGGCVSTAAYTVTEVDLPVFSVRQVGQTVLCVPADVLPANPEVIITTPAGNLVEWFVNGMSQGTATANDTVFTYVWQNVLGGANVTAVVTDAATGCTGTFDPYKFSEIRCCVDYTIEDPLPVNHAFFTVKQSPNCHQYELIASYSPDSVLCHDFSLTPSAGGLSNLRSDPVTGNDTMSLTLGKVGCFQAFSTVANMAYRYDTLFTIDNTVSPPDTTLKLTKIDSTKCGNTLAVDVCNPFRAEFDYTENCGSIFFVDESEIDFFQVTSPLTYTYDFGDGSTPLAGPFGNVSHTYAANGSYIVTLTLSDGSCERTYTQTVVVEDLPDSSFSLSPSVVCAGEAVTFTATTTGSPLVTIEWDFADGALFTGNNPEHAYLDPGTPTVYNVVLMTTNAAGCADTVTMPVTVNPAPQADSIQATNGFRLCPGETTDLFVTDLPGHTYVWSTGDTGASLNTGVAGSYDVTITNTFGCTYVVDSAAVLIAPEPVAAWSGSPVICGSGSTTLTAQVSDGYAVQWINMTTGDDDTTRTFAVNYLAAPMLQEIMLQVTDRSYGCVADTIILVESWPLPLANPGIFGSGCAGDTNIISVAPEPDVSYEWSNGAVGPSITVTGAGTYTVIATHDISGCRATGSVTINGLPDLCIVPTGCYESCGPDTLIGPSGFYGYYWTFDGLPAGTDSFLIVDSSGRYDLTVTDLSTGCFATSGPLFLDVLDCSDQPPVDEDCIKIVSDTIECSTTGGPVLIIEVCAGLDLAYPVGYLDLLPDNMVAGVDLPVGIPLSPALNAGDCRTITVPLTLLPPGSDFCYIPVAHTADPSQDPAALCCSDGEPRCLTIPDCDPCDQLDLISAEETTGTDGCCYNLALFDGEVSFDFDSIVIGLVSGSGTLSTTPTGGTAGLVAGADAGANTIVVSNGGGGPLPDGVSFFTPAICIDGGNDPFYELEVNWMINGKVVCTQSVTVFCEPDCGYLSDVDIECLRDRYSVEVTLHNTSDHAVGSAYLDFPGDLAAYSQTVNIPGGLAPGASTTIAFSIGAPAAPNDSICFRVILHELHDSGSHLNCCAFDACIVTPDCPISPCDCATLRSEVNAGFTATPTANGIPEYILEPRARFGYCDSIVWRIGLPAGSTSYTTVGTGYSLTYNFPGPGLYYVRMEVYRNDGTRVCRGRKNSAVRVPTTSAGTDPDARVSIFPNPATDRVEVFLDGHGQDDRAQPLELTDLHGKPVRTYQLRGGEAIISETLDISGLAPGVYFLRGTTAGKAWAKRLIVH